MITPALANVGFLLKMEELEQMTAKLPKIWKYLMEFNLDPVSPHRTTYPGFVEDLNSMEEEFHHTLKKGNPDTLGSRKMKSIFTKIFADNTSIITFNNQLVLELIANFFFHCINTLNI